MRGNNSLCPLQVGQDDETCFLLSILGGYRRNGIRPLIVRQGLLQSDGVESGPGVGLQDHYFTSHTVVVRLSS